MDGRRILFENVVQVSGHDHMLIDLRVRKFNRTLTVLNGSMIIPHWMDNNSQVRLVIFGITNIVT